MVGVTRHPAAVAAPRTAVGVVPRLTGDHQGAVHDLPVADRTQSGASRVHVAQRFSLVVCPQRCTQAVDDRKWLRLHRCAWKSRGVTDVERGIRLHERARWQDRGRGGRPCTSFPGYSHVVPLFSHRAKSLVSIARAVTCAFGLVAASRLPWQAGRVLEVSSEAVCAGSLPTSARRQRHGPTSPSPSPWSSESLRVGAQGALLRAHE